MRWGALCSPPWEPPLGYPSINPARRMLKDF
jgi:hypothetical protein